MYKKITIQEMSDFLSADKGWKRYEPVNGETYFDFNTKNMIVRVWSSIAGNTSRSKGKDAIRVVLLVDVGSKNVGIKKYPRVTRQDNWKMNLKGRILSAYEDAKNIRECDVCGYPMIERVSKKGHTFYGCSRFPACEHTENV